MRRRFLKTLAGALIASVWAFSEARAGLFCCRLCGSKNCRKVCRLVREDRKITKLCWGVQDEDFCLPNPSCRKCKHCETVCDECRTANGVRSGPHRMVWSDWEPSPCGTVYTRRKLMRKTVTKSVPSFKWVVDDLCQACESALPPVEVPSGTPLPPRPPLPQP